MIRRIYQPVVEPNQYTMYRYGGFWYDRSDRASLIEDRALPETMLEVGDRSERNDAALELLLILRTERSQS